MMARTYSMIIGELSITQLKKQVSKDSLDCYSVRKKLTQLTELWVIEMSHSQHITYIARNAGIIMGKGCIETNYMAIHVSNS